MLDILLSWLLDIKEKTYKRNLFNLENLFLQKESYLFQSVLLVEYKNSQEKKVSHHNLQKSKLRSRRKLVKNSQYIWLLGKSELEPKFNY